MGQTSSCFQFLGGKAEKKPELTKVEVFGEEEIAEMKKFKELVMQELKWIRWSLTDREGNAIKVMLKIGEKASYCESRTQQIYVFI